MSEHVGAALGAESKAMPETQGENDYGPKTKKKGCFYIFLSLSPHAVRAGTETICELGKYRSQKNILLLAAGNCFAASWPKSLLTPAKQLPWAWHAWSPAYALHASGIGAMGARHHLPAAAYHVELRGCMVQDKSDAQHPRPYEQKTQHVIEP